MDVFKVMVPSGTALEKHDGIEYQGKLWLVPSWLYTAGTQKRQPLRLIRFDNIKHQPSAFAGCSFVVNSPVPRAVLHNGATSADGMSFEVIECPPIWLPAPRPDAH